MNYALESQRMQASDVMHNEAMRDPRRGRRPKPKPAPRREYGTMAQKQWNRLNVSMELHLCDSVKARLKELAAKERMS